MKVGPVFPDERHPVQPRSPAYAKATAGELAADHAETATDDCPPSVSSVGPAKEEGHSDRSEFEPRISQIAQMNTAMTGLIGIVPKNTIFTYGSADVTDEETG